MTRADGRLRFSLLCMLALLPASISAAEVEEVTVARDGERFHITMRTRLTVSPQAAFDAFTDYDALPDINPAVQRAEILQRSDAGTRVDTRIKTCVAFFCPDFRLTQDMLPGYDDDTLTLSAKVVPELSDYRYGRGEWHFARCDAGTCLSFETELEPDFWVPPLLGTWLMRRELRRQALATSQGIERRARAD